MDSLIGFWKINMISGCLKNAEDNHVVNKAHDFIGEGLDDI